MRLTLTLYVVAHFAIAPIQCGTRRPESQRREESPAEALYSLSERFRDDNNRAAQIMTLRFLYARYPGARQAARARLDLESLGVDVADGGTP